MPFRFNPTTPVETQAPDAQVLPPLVALSFPKLTLPRFLRLGCLGHARRSRHRGHVRPVPPRGEHHRGRAGPGGGPA
jgi:hypothetical protein